MHSAFLTQRIRTSYRQKRRQSPRAGFCRGWQSRHRPTEHWKGKISAPAATTNSALRFDEKHRDLCWKQGPLSGLPAPAAAGTAQPKLSWFYCLPDKRGRNLAMTCHPLCDKVQLCPHDWDISRQLCLEEVYLCKHAGRNEVLRLKPESRARSNTQKGRLHMAKDGLEPEEEVVTERTAYPEGTQNSDISEVWPRKCLAAETPRLKQ